MTDHLLDAVTELLASEDPRNRNGLEENQKQHGHSTGRIVVENLEDVHASLYDAQSNETVTNTLTAV